MSDGVPDGAAPDGEDHAGPNSARMYDYYLAVAAMAAAGVGQFLDVGSGLPTSPSVHEVARQTAPDARVVSVDYDHFKLGCVPMISL